MLTPASSRSETAARSSVLRVGGLPNFLPSGIDTNRLNAIGITGQMHGAVLLDRELRPLRPAILWNDGRASEEALYLKKNFPELAKKMGVLPMAGLTAPKLLWLKKHEPDVFAKTCWLLSPKDYIRLYLTGELATDYSDAAGTWLFDQAGRCWSREAAGAVDISTQILPKITESTQESGHLTAETAAALNLVSCTPVAGGGGDTPVGALGFGCIQPGKAVISLGTSAHIFTPTLRYTPAVDSMIHSFCHCLPDLWYQMAAMLNGASTLQWACTLVGKEIHTMEHKVQQQYKGPGDLLFLPYLSGERTPHNDAQARGVFFGLTPTTSKTDVCLAVLEGVAYSLADGLDCLLRSGTEINQAAIAGGGAKSRIWAQIIASVLNMDIIRYRGKENGPAFGAARLAQLAVSSGSLQEICPEPDIEEILAPELKYVKRYQNNQERFRRLYKKLQPEFHHTPGE